MTIQNTNRPLFWLKWLAVLIGLSYVALFFWQPIHLPTADLGRHITNGQVILAEGFGSAVLRTNYYSLTESATPAINHHWLFGVVSAVIYRIGDFTGLSLIAMLVQLLTISIVVGLSVRLYGWSASILTAVIALPLITQRIEVRPELMSGLLLALSLLSLTAFHERKLRFRWLLLLQLLIQLVWINMHLFFIFNFALIGVFALFDIRRWRQWLVLLGGALAIGLLNPATWQGLLAPLGIFSNYEYMVAENQNVWFLWKRLGKPIYLYVLGCVGFLIGALTLWLVTLNASRWRTWRQAPSAPITILALIFGLATLIIFRVMPYFGLLFIPALASLLHHTQWRSQLRRLTLNSESWLLILPAAAIIVMLVFVSRLFVPNLRTLTLGIAPSAQQSIAFVQQHIPAPIFNNYDVGGMLIFALHPNQPVYVDNRPEAYPGGFFPHSYIAPQESDEAWQELLDQHQFQSIVFHRHDMTDWAQPFLIKRIADADWQPVYVDESLLILVRDNEQNLSLIEQFALPKEMFTTQKNQES